MTQINTKKVRTGAVLLILAPIVFLIIEAISAAAWIDPSYSYTYNFISDLGIPVVTEFEGRPVTSPLFSLMNVGFVAYADLLVAGFCFLYHALTEKRRILATTLTVLYGVGVTFIALFPGYDWEFGFMHGVGAMPVFFGGSVALMLYGTLFSRLIPRKWYKGLCIVFGILTFIGTVTCIALSVDFRGLLERVALYPMLTWAALSGILVLTNLKKENLK